MCAIAHQLEAAGLPTTLIALVKPHAEKIRPPRALWVPFELGRPLGAPGDSRFQHRVIKAALKLLGNQATPVLNDFPEDAPPDNNISSYDENWVCPVSFNSPSVSDHDTHATRLAAEVSLLVPWHEAWKRKHGRTGFGLTGLEPEKLADFFGSFADGQEPGALLPGSETANTFKLGVNDLLTFYQEAANAQPGAVGNTAEINSWFWNETEAGQTLLAIRKIGGGNDTKLDFVIKRLTVPHVAEAIINKQL